MDVGVRCIISLWKVASFRNREVIRYLFQKNEPRLSIVGAFAFYINKKSPATAQIAGLVSNKNLNRV